MRQEEATPQRPFYSVSYQYARNPYTNYSCNHLGKNPMGNGRTLSGTDDLALAKLTADACVKSPGIRFAYVHKTEDCYNHSEVYRAETKQTTNHID